MPRFVQALVALVALTSCTSPTHQEQIKGPQAVGVSPNAPKDAIGIMLDWTPNETITNFKHLDKLFPVRTVRAAFQRWSCPTASPSIRSCHSRTEGSRSIS